MLPRQGCDPLSLIVPRESALTLGQQQPAPSLESALIKHSLPCYKLGVRPRKPRWNFIACLVVYGLGMGTGPNDLLTAFWKWGSRSSIWLNCHQVGVGQGHTQARSCVECLAGTEARERRLQRQSRGRKQAGAAPRLPCESFGSPRGVGSRVRAPFALQTISCFENQKIFLPIISLYSTDGDLYVQGSFLAHRSEGPCSYRVDHIIPFSFLTEEYILSLRALANEHVDRGMQFTDILSTNPL